MNDTLGTDVGPALEAVIGDFLFAMLFAVIDDLFGRGGRGERGGRVTGMLSLFTFGRGNGLC